MKHVIILSVALFLSVVGSQVFGQGDFYISTEGSDDWSGTLADPDPQGNDGPFATLERVRDAVRDLKRSKSTDIIVQIRGGTYPLSETVVFSIEDSGAGESTVTYEAYPSEKPVFSSGGRIENWKQISGKLPGLPKEAQGKVLVADVSGIFKTLYDGEGMLPRAQSERFVPLQGGSNTELRFPEGRLKNWPNVEDVEILVRPTRAWMMNVLPLASVDEDAGIAHTAIPATYAMQKYGCWVENVLEELDQPGEWALNTKEGKVYLWPRGKSPVMAPQLIEFIRIEGEIDKPGPKDIPVRNLSFRGLTFKHGERYTLAQDDAGLQHDWDMFDKGNALVRLRGTEKCVVEQCHFLHSGSGAIRVDLHGMQNKISGNHIEHMGGGGILLCGYGPATKDVNKRNLVYNNHIHHLVAETNAQGAIRTDGGQMDTLIAENIIYKCKSQGMTLKLNNRFENNIIADVIAPRGTYLKIVEGPMKGASNKRNIFYSSLADCTFISEPGGGTGRVGEDRRGRMNARMKDIESDQNIYFCKADQGLGDDVLNKLHSDGVDANSRAVDPMFVDPENGDFRFKPNSPALEMGILPIDLSMIGLREGGPR